MCSKLKHRGVKFAIALVFGFCPSLAIPLPSVADTLNLNGRTIWGQVIKIDKSGIVIARGCDVNRRESHGWTIVEGIEFDNACRTDEGVRPVQSGATAACNGNAKPLRIFFLDFGNDGGIVGSDIFLDNATLRTVTIDGSKYESDRSVARSLQKAWTGSICREDLPPNNVPRFMRKK
jgi:hypothetical protein